MAILREFIGTQRGIIKDTYGNETAVKVRLVRFLNEG